MPNARDVTEVKGIKQYRYFAGGEWHAAEGDKLLDVYLNQRAPGSRKEDFT